MRNCELACKGCARCFTRPPDNLGTRPYHQPARSSPNRPRIFTCSDHYSIIGVGPLADELRANADVCARHGRICRPTLAAMTRPSAGLGRASRTLSAAAARERYAYGSIFEPRACRNCRIQAGWPGQAAAVTSLPSAWAFENVSSASTYLPPARSISGRTAG